MVVVRKDLEILKGQRLFFERYDYFFYITNDRRRSAKRIVLESNQRCAQEKLIGELKNSVRALHSPVDSLVSNWALHADGVFGLESQGLAGPTASRCEADGSRGTVRRKRESSGWAFEVSSTTSSASPLRS